MHHRHYYSSLLSKGTFEWSQNIDYDQLGNIEMKLNYPQGAILDNAVYGEDINNPNAITSADVNSSLWPLATQSITYNSFNKLTTITEAPYHLAISYGYDHQRTYQELTQSDVVITKKTFVGDGLEIIEKPGEGTIQKIHYLTGGDGTLFAMYVVDQNNQGKMYYIYTDHLGSPNLITDAGCNVVQELSYDAWGNRRDPATWQPYTSLASIPSPLIDRGFTFHEHLYPFTLINMNGRAYDPLVGRFLSADPYIQAPDNPQNLNRYSYCLNNPLRYTDPSGEIIPLLVGMAVGGIANWMMNGCNFDAEGLLSFGIGAAAGAIGASVGAGISSAYAGGSFWAGAIGSSTAQVAATSFWSGAAIGGGAGFASGAVAGYGNALLQGKTGGEAFNSAIFGGLIGGFTGAAIGGLASGSNARNDERTFWKGDKIYKTPERLQSVNQGISSPELNMSNFKSQINPIYSNSEFCFDGQEIELLDNYHDGSQVVRDSWSSTSGPWGNGRLPQGLYSADNLRLRTNLRMVRDGFGFSVDLNPQFQTTRQYLRIHPDGAVSGNWWSNNGTEGCIGLQVNNPALRSFYNQLYLYFHRVSSSIIVRVNY